MFGWLGLAVLGQAKKWRLCFVECIFEQISTSGGVDDSQIATGRLNLISQLG
jgi:hypothetical protein